MNIQLTLTEDQHLALKSHLFPGDGLEAVAFILCGRALGLERTRLVAKAIVKIPHKNCERSHNCVVWNTDDILSLLERAEVEKVSIIKVHSHPQGFSRFSEVDNESDAQLLPTIQSWIEADIPHGSVVMLPSGEMFGRYLWKDKVLNPIDGINIVGSSLQFWWNAKEPSKRSGFGASHDQAFGDGTTERMNKLSIAVIGASGTGGPLIEQLMRLGVGHLVLVDDDVLEERNLNRIPYATADDVLKKLKKVQSVENDILRKGLGTKVTVVDAKIQTAEAVCAVSKCDVMFGCVDTAHGRFIMNLLASHYLLAYFDIGILIDAEQSGKRRGDIKNIFGTIDYLVPGRSSLITRDRFTMDDVRTEGLHENDPAAAKQQVEDKYIKGMHVRRPAVISVNTLAASLAVNDFLARLHPYRKSNNSEIASIEFSLADIRLTVDEEVENCSLMGSGVGYGDRLPLLGLPELG